MNNPNHRNVVLMIADDWSPIAGCYGNKVIQTPHVDSFAARGVVFDHAFCPSPSCAASRACLLTGLHVHQHGQYGHTHAVHHFRTFDHVQSIPRILRSLGFATACIGKKHVDPSSVYPFEFEPEINHRSPTDLAEKTRAFLAANTDKPFYMHVGWADPHRTLKGFGNEFTNAGVNEITYDPDDVIVPDFLPDIPEVRRDLAAYYQSISRTDQCIGAVLREIERSGRASDTLLIVMSDHGMPFPGAKASSFDTGHHTPLIIVSPDQTRRGIRHRALLNWTDLTPTILEWSGVRPPENLPGRSLLPILEQPDAPGWDETYWSHCFHGVIEYNPYRVLRGRRYKLVRNLAHDFQTPMPTDLYRSPTWQAILAQKIEMMGRRPTRRFLHRDAEELYDIEADPMETKNLVNDPAMQQVVADMRRKLMDFRVRTNDPWMELSHQRNEPGAVAEAGW